MRKFISVLIIIILIVIVCSRLSDSSSKLKTKNPKITEFVEQCEKEGVITKLNVEYNEVYVTSAFWEMADAQQKEDFSAIFAQYCGERGSTYRITIYDSHTAKKIATFSKAYGFQIY